MVVYELHLLNFIKKNITELQGKADYFKGLGVTHLEIMPIHKSSKESVWGYSPVSWTEVEYGTKQDWKKTLQLLKDNGIGCIIDVVYNHTSPFEEFDMEIDYIKSNGHHTNYTGCGNTVDGHSERNKKIIIDSLVNLKELGFVGFRFDLGSALAYDKHGNYRYEGSVLEEITNNAELEGMVLINEPWTCHGHHRGWLPSRWIEWNDSFRDAVRHYIRHDRYSVGMLMNVMNDKTLNYVTCHDGFTLMDLVSYNEKNNWENGEQNRDGTNNNISHNNGVEGLTEDESVLHRREQKILVALALLLLSRGTPMVSAGDECGKTQHGNNNAYKKIFPFKTRRDFDLTGYIKDLIELRNKIDYSETIIFCDKDKKEHIDLFDGHRTEFVLKFKLKSGGYKYILIDLNYFDGTVRELV